MDCGAFLVRLLFRLPRLLLFFLCFRPLPPFNLAADICCHVIYASQIEESTCSLKYYNNESKDMLLGLVPLKNADIFDPLAEAQKRGSIDPKQLGRIMSATAADSPSAGGGGGGSAATACGVCSDAFSLMSGARTCRNCALSVCDKCSSQRAPLPHLGIEDQVFCLRGSNYD